MTTDADYVDSVYRKAVEVGLATWVGALQKLNGRVLQPEFTCNTSVPATQWRGGHELYQYVIGRHFVISIANTWNSGLEDFFKKIVTEFLTVVHTT